MCYYDNYKFACNDWKWGNFRQHCQKEYRTGETCGAKLIYETMHIDKDCTMCEKIERKRRRLDKHKEDYARWSREPHKFKATLEKTYREMQELVAEIQSLMQEKELKARSVGNPRRA